MSSLGLQEVYPRNANLQNANPTFYHLFLSLASSLQSDLYRQGTSSWFGVLLDTTLQENGRPHTWVQVPRNMCRNSCHEAAQRWECVTWRVLHSAGSVWCDVYCTALGVCDVTSTAQLWECDVTSTAQPWECVT
jgi:hypothetical protein